MNPNLDLLDAVVAHIEAHPEQHDQTTWFCGTTACIAGRTALMSGWKPYSFKPGHTSHSVVFKDDEVRHVEDVARDLLRIDQDTVDDLFNPDNTLGDILRIQRELHEAARIADGTAAVEVGEQS